MPGWFESADVEKEKKHFEARKTLKPEVAGALDYLYGRLNIIDAKVSSLLTVNSILLAVLAVAVTEDVRASVGWLNVLALGERWLVLVGVFWAISTGLCLRISLLSWEYLPSDSQPAIDAYGQTVIRVTASRTRLYNVAVAALMAAMVLATLPVAVHAVGQTPPATTHTCDIPSELGTLVETLRGGVSTRSPLTVTYSCAGRTTTLWLDARE